MKNNKITSMNIVEATLCTVFGTIMIFFAVRSVIDYQSVKEKMNKNTLYVTATADNVEKYTESHGTGNRTGVKNSVDKYKTDYSYIVGKTRYVGSIVRDIYTEKGDTFGVYVDPDDPAKGLSADNINRQGERIILAVLLSLFGVLLMSVSFSFVVADIKNRRSR